MHRATWAFVIAGLLCGAGTASAGTVYEVVGKSGSKTITYEVKFGGGFRFEQFTAFDPESKEFAYLEWERDAKPPVPAMQIWDHRTGETIPLYKFPNVEHPLPVIPSIEAMKVCPVSGDKQYKSKAIIAYD
jgi:hypothetical protein